MAIDITYLEILQAMARMRLKEAQAPRRIKAACLAYPDLLVHNADLARLYGDEFVANLKMSDDQAAIYEWHKLRPEFGPVYDTRDFLAKIGIEIEVLDIARHRGNERIVDLNEPLPKDLFGAYEIVIDTGTMEHCFNVGVAFRNVCEMTALSGLVVTMVPITVVNHGFWNFCPTALYDGFAQNGFKIILLKARQKNENGTKVLDLLQLPLQRVHYPPDVAMICVARKVVEQPFIWPVQSKYKDLWRTLPPKE